MIVESRSSPLGPQIIRWTARLLWVLSAVAFLAFLFGTPPPNPTSASFAANFQFASFAVVVFALLAAWRWEWQGAVVSLLALGAFYGLEYTANGRLPHGAFPLFAIPAALYLLSTTLASRRGSASTA